MTSKRTSKSGDQIRRYRRMTFARLQKWWMRTSVGRRRGALKPRPERLELALNLTSFDMGARLQIISELMAKKEPPSDTPARIKDHCKELAKEADFLQKAGLYLIDVNRC